MIQLRRIKNLVFKQKITRISIEGWITDLGFSVRMNLGKFSIPIYEAFTFWVMAQDRGRTQGILND